jgi:hypothetical protein
MNQPFPGGAVQFMKDLYTAIKTDPDTQNLIIIGIALGTTITYDNPNNPLGNDGNLTNYVDWGNFHPYPGFSQNFPG